MPLSEEERLKIQKQFDNLADKTYDLIMSQSRAILDPDEDEDVQKFPEPEVSKDEEED